MLTMERGTTPLPPVNLQGRRHQHYHAADQDLEERHGHAHERLTVQVAGVDPGELAGNNLRLSIGLYHAAAGWGMERILARGKYEVDPILRTG